jgi:hypothetical protein
MARVRNYRVYCVGLLVAWLIVLSVSTAINGANPTGAAYITFFGLAIGWVSTTIARYLYPPPAKWNSGNRTRLKVSRTGLSSCSPPR